MLHVLNIIKGMCRKLVLENGMYIFKVASLHTTDTGTSKSDIDDIWFMEGFIRTMCIDGQRLANTGTINSGV